MPWLQKNRPPLTDDEEGWVGNTSLVAKDVDVSVKKSLLEPRGPHHESVDMLKDGSTIPTFTNPRKQMNFCKNFSLGLFCL